MPYSGKTHDSDQMVMDGYDKCSYDLTNFEAQCP